MNQSKTRGPSASQVLGQRHACSFPLEFNLNKQSITATPCSPRLQKEKQKLGLENNDQKLMLFRLENKKKSCPSCSDTNTIRSH